MATAELNAHEVNIACHAALIGNDPVVQQGMLIRNTTLNGCV